MTLSHSGASELAQLMEGTTAGALIPEIVRRGFQDLLEAEVSAAIGAQLHERRPEERSTHRNGNRQRDAGETVVDRVAALPPSLKLTTSAGRPRILVQPNGGNAGYEGSAYRSADGSADVMLTFRNVHNWTGWGTDQAMFDAFFRVLKPGGVLGVVDHRAKPGTDLEAMKKSGYLTEAYVRALAERAGFVLEASSEVNANPRDTTVHPNGVWTLPPSNRHDPEDAQMYRSIGESDRMTLRFRKPARD